MTFPRQCSSLVLLGLLPLLAVPAIAAANPQAEVAIGGVLIQTIRTTWGGLTPEQRAAQVQMRLNSALSDGPVHSSDFTVGQLDDEWCVLFRGRRFLTADPLTARQDDSDPHTLALTWAKRLQEVIPPLTAPTNK